MAATSAWVRSLRKTHGAGLVVGSVAYDSSQTYWVSSLLDEEPSHAEFEAFSRRLDDQLQAVNAAHLPGVAGLSAPYLLGDFYLCRTEMLILDAITLVDRVDALVVVLETVHRHVAAHPRFRVGYLDADASIVVYPDAVFVDRRRFTLAASAKRSLQAWLRRALLS